MTRGEAEEVVRWLAAGLPPRPESATFRNPKGMFTTAECLQALARLAVNDLGEVVD